VGSITSYKAYPSLCEKSYKLFGVGDKINGEQNIDAIF